MSQKAKLSGGASAVLADIVARGGKASLSYGKGALREALNVLATSPLVRLESAEALAVSARTPEEEERARTQAAEIRAQLRALGVRQNERAVAPTGDFLDWRVWMEGEARPIARARMAAAEGDHATPDPVYFRLEELHLPWRDVLCAYGQARENGDTFTVLVFTWTVDGTLTPESLVNLRDILDAAFSPFVEVAFPILTDLRTKIQIQGHVPRIFLGEGRPATQLLYAVRTGAVLVTPGTGPLLPSAGDGALPPAVH